MTTTFNKTLPSGTVVWEPTTPRTWVEASSGVRGDALRAKYLEADVSAAVALHRLRPMFQAYRSATLSVVTGTWTPIPLDVELIDTTSGHSDTSNTDRWYAPNTATAGGDYYLCVGYAAWSTSDAANIQAVGIKKSSEANPREGALLSHPAGHDTTGMVCDLIQLDGAFSHYVSLQGWHNHGSNASLAASSHVASLTVQWVSAGTGTLVSLPAAPRTWTATDEAWADSTGGNKVPLNVELRDRIRFYNYPPVARLTSEGSAQTIPSGATTWTSIQMPTDNVDNYTGWSSGANTKYTFPRAGLYFVYGQAALSSTNAGAGTFVAARLRHAIAAGGTADYYGGATVPPTTATTGTTVGTHSLIRVAASDSVEVQASHNLGASKSVKTTAGGASRLIAVWIAA